MIPYGKQTIDKDDINSVVEVLKSDFLTTGPNVKEFEEKFASYVGSRYAIAVSSGTAALHLASLVSGIGKSDEVLTSPMTFAASANCALYCNATPVFVEIKENGLIDEELIESQITERTKAIIPVHYTGNVCNMEKIYKIAEKKDLVVIEDACHALGSEYKSKRVGSCEYSDMACFSFHPVKNITTGEGGMITTNSENLYQQLIELRSHGITRENFYEEADGPWYYEMQELGFNYRLTDMQCALGLNQLGKVDNFVKKRREIAKKYDSALKNIDEIEVQEDASDAKNAYHLYVIKVKNKKNRLKLFNYLKENGILCQVHYIPVYYHPYYQSLGYEKGLCPEAEKFYEKIISLPIYPELTDEQQERVVELIRGYFENGKAN